MLACLESSADRLDIPSFRLTSNSFLTSEAMESTTISLMLRESTISFSTPNLQQIQHKNLCGKSSYTMNTIKGADLPSHKVFTCYFCVDVNTISQMGKTSFVLEHVTKSCFGNFN